MRSSSQFHRSTIAWAAAAILLCAVAVHGNLAFAQAAPAPTPAPKASSPAPTPSTSPAPAPAPAPAPSTSPATPAAAPASGIAPPVASAPPGPAAVAAEDKPVSVRLRSLEQRVQALKERAWRAKARVGMLKETAIGGGAGAAASLVHTNKMGSSFRLIKLVFAVDGTQVFARTDDTAETLYKTKSFDILNGPIAPGSHTLSVVAVYRGHGYGVFKYLSKYTFQARAQHTFTVEEGKGIKVESIGYEKGGANTPMEKRSAIDFKVSQLASGK